MYFYASSVKSIVSELFPGVPLAIVGINSGSGSAPNGRHAIPWIDDDQTPFMQICQRA